MPEIIVGGGPLDVIGAGRTDLRTVSKPCRIGECDAFFSHSWHDDAHQKWDALRDWCTVFENTIKRSPRLWLDKVCIDQANIQADLQCLPIFLAGCNLLLIISGPTYTFRLWCCVELFVYVAMHMEDDSRKVPVIILIGADDEERARVHTSFTNFDAKVCKCFKEEDKARMLGIVEQHPGGMQGFNSHVRALAATLCRSSRPSQTSSSSSCSQSSRPASMDASGWAEFSGSVASFEWHGTERCHSLTSSASTNRNCDAIGFSVLPEATVIPGSVTSA